MTAQYDFARSPIAPSRFQELVVYLRVDNVTDKQPIFSNGGVGGVNAMHFPALGRNYQLGLRMQF
jgi:outer membrane receptor protein involved in Fe transport